MLYPYIMCILIPNTMGKGLLPDEENSVLELLQGAQILSTIYL